MKKIAVIALALMLTGCSSNEMEEALKQKEQTIVELKSEVESLMANAIDYEGRYTEAEKKLADLEKQQVAAVEALETNTEHIQHLNEVIFDTKNERFDDVKYKNLVRSVDISDQYEVTRQCLYTLSEMTDYDEDAYIESRVYKTDLNTNEDELVFTDYRISNFVVSEDDQYIAVSYARNDRNEYSYMKLIRNDGEVVAEYDLTDVFDVGDETYEWLSIHLSGFSLDGKLLWAGLADDLTVGEEFSIDLETGELTTYATFEEWKAAYDAHPQWIFNRSN